MKRWLLLLTASFFLILQGCGGGGGGGMDVVIFDPEPPPEECPDCVTPPPTQTLNEQHREDAGLSQIAPNGAFPGNHKEVVKPKFVVIQSTTNRDHGRYIQAAACAGYAPGGCTVNVSSNDVQGVSNAPFTFIEPRNPDHVGSTFQEGELGARLREHPNLKIASMSVSILGSTGVSEITREGVKAVWSAGNDGVVNWREANPSLWDREDHAEDPEWDGVLDGDKFLRQIANHDVLLVAGYTKDANGNFIPSASTTQCEGVDRGCLYAPDAFDFEGRNGSSAHASGTSFSAPFVAAGLASVLAVFPETSGEELIALAKACAVSEPGLKNGLGRFSLSCMDNSEVFHLDKEEEGSVGNIQARATQMVTSFANTPLPGDSQFTMEVEGVSLTRNMEGSFAHRSGIVHIPLHEEGEENDTLRVNLFYDDDNQAQGLRVGNENYFLVGSWTNQNSFFGLGQYRSNSLNAAVGTDTLYLRMTKQHGRHLGGGVVDKVEGSSIGATLTHTVTTPLGDLIPFLHVDKFTGGKAKTSFGTMQLKESEWNAELGLSAEAHFSALESLLVTATATHLGDLDRDDYGVRAKYRLLF